MTMKEEQQVRGEVEHILADESGNMDHQLVLDGLLDASKDNSLTPVGQLFNGRSVFITGASGFIGRVLLEKLLRSYAGIKRIYVLLRPKRNLQPYERLHKHLLKVPIFDQIRSMKNGQDLLDKIAVVSGDIGEPMLGLSPEDQQKLLNDSSLSVVFHSAASVKFDEPLKSSIKYNLQATKCIIQLCKQMKNLRCLCHVSTAYVNSDQRDNGIIEERIYPMSQQPEQVLKLAELMDEDMMQKLKPYLVGQRPNTYTYTKALAEHLIALEASQLPVVIVRPSIVIAAWKEPLKGWIDNLNGPTGLILAIGKGLLRTMCAVRSCKADVIPVDIVVNTMIAAAHYTAKQHAKTEPKMIAKHQLDGLANVDVNKTTSIDEQSVACDLDKQAQTQKQQIDLDKTRDHTKKATSKHQEPPIFHCTSGDVNPITWGQMEQMFWPIILRYPSQQVLRYPYGTFKENRYHDLFMRLIVHYLPALFIDLLCLITGKKRQLLMIYNKLHKATEVLRNFCITNYNFSSSNLKILEQSLTDERDKTQLYMDIRTLDWLNFWEDYVLGARRYVLKEDDSSLPESRRSFKRMRLIELGFRVILLFMAMSFVYPLVESPLRQLAASFMSAV